jgi:gliding motility-associated-like protein
MRLKTFINLKNLLMIIILFFAKIANSQVNFSPSVRNGCSPLLVNFNETHSKPIVKRFWDFGNSATSTLENPSTIYTSNGRYTVTLITEDSNGIFDTIKYVNLIEVFSPPTAFFESNVRGYCVNDTVLITDKSTTNSNSIKDYLWDFGDGKTYSVKDPKHAYANAGNYTVTLLVIDDKGCKSTHRETFFYNITELPKINFTTDKTINCGKPLSVKFNSTVSSKNVKSYFWEFGDGKTSTNSSPTHNYDSIGKFNVKFTVVDSNGCKNTISKENIVENLELKSSFEDISSRLCDNESISFKNLSTPKRSDIRYRWEFGDGTTSTQSEPTKKYTQSGNYTIKLISFIPNTQCADTFILNKRIDIIKTQNIVPLISDTLFCQLPKRVFFEPSDTVLSAFWRFTTSPFDTSSKIKSSFLFTRTGNFNISYEFKDTNGCIIKGTKSGGVRITTQTVNIVGQLIGCAPRTETFSVQTTNASNIVSYSWFLDDTLVGTNSTYTHNFKTPRTGNLRVVVRTNENCEYFRTVNYNYGGKTNPDFFPVNTEMCFSQSIKFFIVPDSTRPPITGVEWIFEDQKKSTGEHKFNEFKNQKVTLITRSGTCADTTIKFFDITGDNNSIKGPVSQIGINYDTCGRILRIKNNSLSYTSHRWNIYWDGTSKVTNINDNEFIYYLDDSSQNFNIKLTTFNDSNMCPEDTMVVKLKTVGKLFTSFTFNGDFCAPSEVQFTNTSNYSSADTFRWFVNGSQVQKSDDDESLVSSSVNIDYIKGQTGNFNPLFKFGNSGEYEIMLIGKRYNCIDTIKQIIKIGGPDINPKVIKNNNCLPLSITLIDSNYRDNKNSFWVISNVDTIWSTSQSISRVLEKTTDSGLVKIKYVEWSDSNCLSWKIINLPVSGPFVDFTEKLITTCDSAFIEFTPNIQNVGVNDKLFFLWELGDSTITNNSSKFRYRYKENNTYDVKLTVTDDKNCFSSNQKEVNYFEKLLKADLTADSSGIFCPPVKIGFKNNSTSGSPIIKYTWQFGDGTSSSEENPEKVFTFPGVYSVKLTVEDLLGCVDSIKLPDFILVNEPRGEFIFDREFGCVPLDVNFKLMTNNPTNKVIWDMGDGRILADSNFMHIYDRPGDFYPMLIITDTFGCEYIVPRDKRIKVYPQPKLDFEILNSCYGDTIYFKNTSVTDENQTYTFFWYVNDSLISDEFDGKLFIDFFGNKTVSLSAKSNIGCDDSISKNFKIKSFDINIDIKNRYICLGEKIIIESHVNDEQEIVEYRWTVSDGTIHTEKNLEYIPEKSGEYDVELYVKNIEGCDTTLFFENLLLILDTIPNKNPEILSVSVLDNFSVEIKHRASDEINFKSYRVYRRLPNNDLKLVRETTNINDTFLIETNLNTLSNVYCYIITEMNSCEYESLVLDSLFHCTIDVKGTPDTNVSVLTWNAYHGWAEVSKYEIYRKKEAQDVFTKLDEVSGDSLSYIDKSITCKSSYFYRILAYDKNSNEISWSDTCRVTPFYFNIVPSPKYKLSSVLNNRDIELYWDGPINSRNPISYYLMERSDINPDQYKPLVKINNTNNNFYIDRNNLDVNSFNYYYRIKAIDDCEDESEYSEFTRPILLKAKLTDDFKPFLTWTPYKKWDEGVAYYEIEQLINQEFIKINQTLTGIDTNFIHEDVIQNCFSPYVYRVIGVKNIIDDYSFSYSNEVKLNVKPRLYIPNAFSPNGDGLNDIFLVKGIFIKTMNMRIYNRWGEKLFEENGCFPTWNGVYMDKMVPDGVYLVMITAIGADDKVYTYKTTLTAIK